MPVIWRATDKGFEFIGLPEPDTEAKLAAGADQQWSPRKNWLGEDVSVRDAVALILGPEPIIARQAIVLQQGDNQVRIATDGLRPFALQAAELVGAGP